MSIESQDELLIPLTRLEHTLHQPTARRDSSRLQDLLHESFVEFGYSGASYDRAGVIDLLASDEAGYQILSRDFELTSLGTHTALLTYKSASIDDHGEVSRYALRASVWALTPTGWRLRFHQATPTAEFEIAADDRQFESPLD